jgi:hypothetical protein
VRIISHLQVQVAGFALRRNAEEIVNIHRRLSGRRMASQALPMMNLIVTFPKMT